MKAADAPDSLGGCTSHRQDHSDPFGSAADPPHRKRIEEWRKACVGQSGKVHGAWSVPAWLHRGHRVQKSSTERSASMKTDDPDPESETAEYAATVNLHKEYVAARNRLCRAENEF